MYYIIVNPASKSGRGTKIWSVLEPVLSEREIEYKVFFSKEAGHVIKLVRDLSASLLSTDSESIMKLIILGGDGTLDEALQGISDFSRVQIGYIPTGSSNDMARDLALPQEPLTILENILSCTKPTPMDLGCLEYNSTSEQFSRQHDDELSSRRYFAVSSGIGFDAAVCEEALSSKFKKVLNKLGLGKLIYLIIALKQLIMAQKVTCTLTLDDKREIKMTKFLFVASMVHRYEGGGFKFCPDADCHDGVLDLCSASKVSKGKVLIALPSAFKGEHFKYKGIDHYTATRVHIETSAPLWVHTDGEVAMKSNSITVTCEKDKLQLLL